MAVFYNSETGQYDVESQSLNPITEAAFLANQARLHTGTGWHEYGSIAAMNAAVAQNHWPKPQQNNNPITAAQQQATGVASHAATSVIPNAFNLVFGNTTGLMGRILKVVFGGILIIAGVMRMTGAKKDIIAIASTAAKGAVL